MKKIVILGGGESGVGAALLAAKKGIECLVSDYGPIAPSYKKELEAYNIPFEEKGHSFEKFGKADYVVVSPGIPDNSKVVQWCIEHNLQVVSEIEFAYPFYDGNIIGITGSNGKTTTASLIYHLIRDEDYDVGLGGNIGYSFSRMLTDDVTYEWLVLELSSFQLDRIHDFKADIGVLLNITADHLDRYDYDIAKYAAAKWNLAKAVKKEGHLIINDDDLWIKRMEQANPVQTKIHRLSAIVPINTLSSKEDEEKFEMKLKGKHNEFNAAVAIKCAGLLGIDPESIKARLHSFDAIEHRMEMVAQIDEVTFINDSKATNVDAAMYALESVDAPVIWIAGGTDKGNDYSVMADVVSRKVSALICLCADDSRLLSAFRQIVPVVESTTQMDQAIVLAIKYARPGSTVLLSPACASFDLFDNYEHRGEAFKESINKIVN